MGVLVGVWVVIIKLKANLSSTSHLTSQLELSLAISQLLLTQFGPNFMCKVKAMSRQGQGKVKRQGQGKINVKSNQSNTNHNHNYNLMGFDTIEINLVLKLYLVNFECF